MFVPKMVPRFIAILYTTAHGLVMTRTVYPSMPWCEYPNLISLPLGVSQKHLFFKNKLVEPPNHQPLKEFITPGCPQDQTKEDRTWVHHGEPPAFGQLSWNSTCTSPWELIQVFLDSSGVFKSFHNHPPLTWSGRASEWRGWDHRGHRRSCRRWWRRGRGSQRSRCSTATPIKMFF